MLKIAQFGFTNAIMPALIHPDMDVRAHCDVREKNRIDTAKLVGFIKNKMKEVKAPTPFHSYADYREMLAKEDLDLVVVSTPHRFHAKMALAAMRQGCHVLVEKPMCVTLDECEQLVAAVKASGLKLAVNQNVRLSPGFHYLFDRRDAGDLGQIYYVKANYLHRKDPRVEEQPGNSVHEYSPLFSFGSHPIDLVLGLLDTQAETVYACGAKQRTDARFKFNDAIALTLRTPDRRIGESLTTAACIREGFFGFELFGTKMDAVQTTNYYPKASSSAASIAAGQQGLYEDRFKPIPVLGLVLTGTDSSVEEKFTFAPKTLEHLDGHMGSLYGQLQNLVYAIQDNLKPSVMADVIDGARCISVCVAAEESQASGQAVSVRQWERFITYSRQATMPNIDDYCRTVLNDYARYLEPQNRRAILEDKLS